MRPPLAPLVAAGLALLLRVGQASAAPAVLVPIVATPTSVSLNVGGVVTTGVDRAAMQGTVVEVVGNRLEIRTGPTPGVFRAAVELEIHVPEDTALGSLLAIRRAQSAPFAWAFSPGNYGNVFGSSGMPAFPAVLTVSEGLLENTETLYFESGIETETRHAFPGDVLVVDVGFQSSGPFGSPNQFIRLDFLLATTPPISTSAACRADITGDGIVNFGDVAKLKSAMFQRCTP